jgi:hypothetical protein
MAIFKQRYYSWPEFFREGERSLGIAPEMLALGARRVENNLRLKII